MLLLITIIIYKTTRRKNQDDVFTPKPKLWIIIRDEYRKKPPPCSGLRGAGRHVFLKPENLARPNVPKPPTYGSALRSSESVAVYFRCVWKKKTTGKRTRTHDSPVYYYYNSIRVYATQSFSTVKRVAPIQSGRGRSMRRRCLGEGARIYKYRYSIILLLLLLNTRLDPGERSSPADSSIMILRSIVVVVSSFSCHIIQLPSSSSSSSRNTIMRACTPFLVPPLTQPHHHIPPNRPICE